MTRDTTIYFIALPLTTPLCPRLLHDMRQLMGNQPPSFVRSWREPTFSKYNALSYRVGVSVHVLRRLLGSRAGMHPHSGKVVAEALLHVLP